MPTFKAKVSRRAFLAVALAPLIPLRTRFDPTPTPPIPAISATPAATVSATSIPPGGPDLSKYAMLYQRTGAPADDAAIQIVVTGDNSMARGTAGAIAGHANNFDYPLSAVSDWLKAADLAVGNQEGVIAAQGVGTERPQGYRLRADPKAAAALAKAGFGLVNLANNHTRDFGPDGIKATMDALHAAKVQTVGAGGDYNAARLPVVTALRGLKVVWLAQLNVPDPPDYGINWEGNGYGRARVEEDRLAGQIKAARALGDVLIAQFHWGIEYEPNPFETQVRLGRIAIDAGADIVIGHHPHVIQSVEVYQKKLIIYSLGNFMFDQDGRSGMAAWLRLDSHGIIDVHAIPVNPGTRPVWAQGAKMVRDKNGGIIVSVP